MSLSLPWFRDCEYSAFISYAHSDDIAWNKWVSSFARELDLTLPHRLRGIPVPKVHQSGGHNGPLNGDLDEQLVQRIAGSFVMVLVVHDNYVESGWCARELVHFKRLFGDEGLQQRLYIVELSQAAMAEAKKTAHWQQVSGGRDLVTMPFYQTLQTDQPISIYSDNASNGAVTNAFWVPFVVLREALVTKIKKSVEAQAKALPPAQLAVVASRPAPAVAASDEVRIYIESNQNERDHWESLGVQVEKCWDKMVAEIGGFTPPLYVRPTGLPMDGPDLPPLDDADGLILLWGQKASDSLIAQIKKVEKKLTDADPAPGMVAYLSPPQEEPQVRGSAWGWKVLSFNAREPRGIEVAPQHAVALEDFLRKALEHKQRQRARAAQAQAAPQAVLQL